MPIALPDLNLYTAFKAHQKHQTHPGCSCCHVLSVSHTGTCTELPSPGRASCLSLLPKESPCRESCWGEGVPPHGSVEWGWRDFTPTNGWEHWKRNKNISFPGIFCRLCSSSQAIPVSDTVPKMQRTSSWRRVLLSTSAVTGHSDSAAALGSTRSHCPRNRCAAARENKHKQGLQGRTCLFSRKHPQQHPGESSSNWKLLCFSRNNRRQWEQCCGTEGPLPFSLHRFSVQSAPQLPWGILCPSTAAACP